MSRMEIEVDNRLRVRGRLDARAAEGLRREFTHANPARAKIASSIAALERSRSSSAQRACWALRKQLKEEPASISTWAEDAGGLSLPRGGLARARSVLEELGHDLRVVDARTEGSPELRHRYEHRVELWDFQRDADEKIAEVEQGIVRSPTGSGKSTLLIASIVRAGLPALIVANTGNLFDQWVRRLRTELGLSRDEVGEVGAGEFRIRPITVGMAQTLVKPGVLAKLVQRFGYLAVDECHASASATYTKIVDAFPARFRIGASDSEKRKDRLECIVYDYIGSPIADVDREDLVDRGFILDVEVRLVETATRIGWWDALPEAQRPTRWLDMLKDLAADEARNGVAAGLAVEGTIAGEQVLVLAHLEEHCLRLQSEVVRQGEPRVGLFVARLKREFQATLAGFLQQQVRCGVGTYKAVGQALDLPLASRGVCASPIHTNRPFQQQVRGRLCRAPEGKASASLYVLWDRGLFGMAPVRSWVKACKTSSVRPLGGEWQEGRAFLKRADADARAAREAAR